jgi:uncharacterized protein (DUF2164 family)
MMIKFVTKVVDKLLIPIVILNIAAIGSVFYNQGKADAIREANVVEEAKEDSEV